jgi:hypothetical protein
LHFSFIKEFHPSEHNYRNRIKHTKGFINTQSDERARPRGQRAAYPLEAEAVSHPFM